MVSVGHFKRQKRVGQIIEISCLILQLQPQDFTITKHIKSLPRDISNKKITSSIYIKSALTQCPVKRVFSFNICLRVSIVHHSWVPILQSASQVVQSILNTQESATSIYLIVLCISIGYIIYSLGGDGNNNP